MQLIEKLKHGFKKLQLNLKKFQKGMQVCFCSSAFCLKYRTKTCERDNHLINIMNELGTYKRVLR